MNKTLITTWLSAGVLTLAAFFAAYQFVEPAPPDTLTLSTGSASGAYHAFGQRLAAQLGRAGVTLNLRNTAGSQENLALLGAGEVDAALVQGGLESPDSAGKAEVRSLASLYYEPLWIFHRMTPAPRTLAELALSPRINRGGEASGTRKLVDELLALNGIDAEGWPGLSDADAAQALVDGQLDGAMIVAGESAPYVQRLLSDPSVQLMDLSRAAAYPLHRRYLSSLLLPAGGIDLAGGVPAEDTHMIAVTAMLVATTELHPALVDLILQSSPEIVGGPGLFNPRGAFPTPRFVSIPLGKEAERFHRRGPSLLQRYLPFWAATLIDRMVVLLLPLVALMLPLMRLFPPIYRWRVRSRIYRWYDDLKRIEARHDLGESASDLLATIAKLVAEVKRVETPLSYSDELYHLRNHIELVRSRIADKPQDD